jgi:hypothetical protein
MRRLDKRRSPGNVSPDGQPRQSMQQAEKAFLVALRSAADAAECARSAFDALETRKLRSMTTKARQRARMTGRRVPRRCSQNERFKNS